MAPSSYPPYRPARRPGGRPATKPRYRVLVHRRLLDVWEQLPDRIGLEAAQQFYDHVADTPGQVPAVGTATILKGSLGRPIAEGFSRTVHYEISGAGRIDYQYHDAYVGTRGDPHPVVFILRIALGSH
jgi:hypothetical protein